MQYVLVVLFCSVLCLFYEVKYVGAEIGHDKVAACYWSTWSTHRPGKGKFLLQDVNPSLCTHLILAFTLLNDTDDSVKVLGKWDDLEVDEKGRNNITKLKEKYPHLRVMVAIGGWQDGSIRYSKMAASPEKRSNFVTNTIKFVRKHNFDGLDLVWEFPTKRGGSINDKKNFVQLVKDLRIEYDKHNLLLTAGLGASKDTIDNGYIIAELSTYLDYMFVMTYDYGGLWSRVIGPNAPLHGPDLLNVEYTIKHILKLGANPKKIILGLPFYGRTYLRLNVTDSNDIMVPSLGEEFNKTTSFQGLYTQEEGFMGYNEICLLLLDRNWFVFWDDESKTPFAVNNEKSISFDNNKSVTEKIRFALDNNLGGVMAWSIDTDDFRGDCHEIVSEDGDYPLLRTVDKVLYESSRHQKELSAKNIDMHPRVSQVESSATSIFMSSYCLLLSFFSLVVMLVQSTINVSDLSNAIL